MVEQAERQLLDKYKTYMKNLQQVQNAASAPTIVNTPNPTSVETATAEAAPPPTTKTSEDGKAADPVVKSEPVELTNGSTDKVVNGTNGEGVVDNPKTMVNGGESKLENGVVANGVDHDVASE